MFVLHAVVTSKFSLEAQLATEDKKLLQINITKIDLHLFCSLSSLQEVA